MSTLLVGDSAANVILGHPTTLPVFLSFMMEITAAVQRGAPSWRWWSRTCLSARTQGSLARGTANVFKMVKQTGCDCVKLEVGESRSASCGSFRRRRGGDGEPGAAAAVGGRTRGLSVPGGNGGRGGGIVRLAKAMEAAGEAALLLEAVPAEVGWAVVDAVDLPVIGCGTGPTATATSSSPTTRPD